MSNTKVSTKVSIPAIKCVCFVCLQVEAPATGTSEVASIYACVLQWQYAQSCRPHHPRHEHCTALYEGPWQSHTRWVLTCVCVF